MTVVNRVVGLVADVGATNVRLALVGPGGRLAEPASLRAERHRHLESVVRGFLATATRGAMPPRAAFAVAAPVTGDEVAMTNRDWSFSVTDLKRRLGVERLEVVNDFVAQAWALPRLAAAEVSWVGGGLSDPASPAVVLGPGTGLGVAALLRGPDGPRAMASEGGHATLAAADERESRLLAILRRESGHVSAERALSGDGLVRLHAAVAEVDGTPAEAVTPAAVTRQALAGACPTCVATLAAFCGLLGSVAGSLALTFAARGGVYVSGGIVPRFAGHLAATRFRERFEAKGRFRDYLAGIPSGVVTRPDPALLGLAGRVAAE